MSAEVGDSIQLLRQCDATIIPSGEAVELPLGTEIIITQALGGSFTVATPSGLVRIDAKDADALGLEIKENEAIKPQANMSDADVEKAAWEQLKLVFDPEIPVNIVDLGLVYSLEVTKTENNARKVDVKMTLTAPGCGMGPTIQADARNKVMQIPSVEDANVDLIWEPPWNQEMITEVGKMKLGMI
jgi:probable FeS assembly SUF system protein SufT